MKTDPLVINFFIHSYFGTRTIFLSSGITLASWTFIFCPILKVLPVLFRFSIFASLSKIYLSRLKSDTWTRPDIKWFSISQKSPNSVIPTTIEENSFIKSRASFKYTGLASVADDTILEVDHLNGEPGLYTARYAGEQATYNQNMDKLIKELHGVEMNMRTARFRTVISYVDGTNDFHVEGVLKGEILTNKIGKNGFGYDPIFYVEKFDKSLAQIDLSIKNEISHRGLAIKKFVSKISELNKWRKSLS